MKYVSLRSSATAVLVLAFSSILSATPRLQLSTTAVGPIYVAPGTNGAQQTITASNAGDGTLNLTAAASAAWLTASVGASTACASQAGTCMPVSISLNTTSLASGNYTGYVTLTAPGVIDAPQQISVNVVVASIPNKITLYVSPGGGTASVNIWPHSAVSGAASTVAGGNWLTFTPPAAGASFGTPARITGTSQTGQAPGLYSGNVTISGSTFQPDNQTINVTLNVTASPIIQVNNQTVRLNGYAGGPLSSATINFTNAGQDTIRISGATLPTANGTLSAAVTSGNAITITADPSKAAAGIYTGTLTITSNAANNADVSIPVEFNVAAAGAPSISMNGIVNIADFLPDSMAPGDIASIFGDQFMPLGPDSTNSTRPPLATQLSNVQVLVNGVAAPLYFVSRQQINFQMPYEALPGQLATVQVVSNGIAGNTRSVSIAATAAKILIWPMGTTAGNYGVIVNGDNRISLPRPGLGLSRTSRPGDVIVIYCVGLGQTSPAVATGAAASSIPLMTIGTTASTATFGDASHPVTAQAAYTGLTPTAVGLYQVNVTIPDSVQTGSSVPLVLNIGGVNTNIANIAIDPK